MIEKIYPFQLGEAVFYTPYTCFSHHMQAHPGVVTRIAKCVTILSPDGRRRAVTPRRLVYQGYCATCERPAHQRDGQLVCPACQLPATPELPPDHLVVRWWPADEDQWPRVVGQALRTGCTIGDAIDTVRNARYATFLGFLKTTGLYNTWFYDLAPFTNFEFKSAFIKAAQLGDVDAGRACYEAYAEQPKAHIRAWLDDLLQRLDSDPDNTGMRVAPKWQPPADDQQPDGEDETTRWLEQKMNRKAA